MQNMHAELTQHHAHGRRAGPVSLYAVQTATALVAALCQGVGPRVQVENDVAAACSAYPNLLRPLLRLARDCAAAARSTVPCV